jgi:hypothetical protein
MSIVPPGLETLALAAQEAGKKRSAAPYPKPQKRARGETMEDIRRRHAAEWYVRYEETTPVEESEYVKRIQASSLPRPPADETLPQISWMDKTYINFRLEEAGQGPLFCKVVNETLGRDFWFPEIFHKLPNHSLRNPRKHVFVNLRGLHDAVHFAVFDYHPRRTALTIRALGAKLTQQEAEATKSRNARMYAVLMGILETIEDLLVEFGNTGTAAV